MNSKKLEDLRAKKFVFNKAYDRIAVIADRNIEAANPSDGKKKLLHESEIFTYDLYSASELNTQIGDLKKGFFEALGIKDGKSHLFSIDSICGWIQYENVQLINSTKISPTVLPESEIWSIAEQFLNKLNDVETSQMAPSIFNEVIPFRWGISTKINNRGFVFRWIIRYGLRIGYASNRNVTSYETRNLLAIIRDSFIEFEIDSLGLINRILLKWRPVKQMVASTLLPHNETNETEGSLTAYILDKFNEKNIVKGKATTHDHDHKFDKIEYFLGGENTFQLTLSPFLSNQSGHHGSQGAFILRSLKVIFLKAFSNAAITISALVEGGSGSYTYDWCAWEIANPENFISLGPERTCSLKGGNFHVLCTVTDNELRIFEQYQEFIFASYLDEPQFPPLAIARPGCTDPKATNYNPHCNCDDGSCIYND